jgi:hypothetical protein
LCINLEFHLYIVMLQSNLLELRISGWDAEYIYCARGFDMEENAIKLLYINSKVRALVNINQAPAGETGISAITQPIAGSATFFITMLPLENEKNFAYLPYTRRISIASGGAIFDNDGLVELCIWPDNIVEVTLHPLTVYKNDESELFPSVIAPFDFYISNERHTAFIYNEAYSSFAVEHSSSSRLVFLSPLPFSVVSADIAFTKINDLPVIYASGKAVGGKPFLYAANILPSFSTAVCALCESHQIDNTRLSVVTKGDFRQIKTVYEKKDSHLAPVTQEIGWFTCQEKEPASAEEVCMCLLQAVKAGMSEAAMRCLTPTLADGLSFSDLKEFFGDFTMSAREFCVDTKQMHGAILIDNIREP